MSKSKYPGWRTMTAAQRYNAKMEAIFEGAKAEGRGLRTIAARDVKVGDVLDVYGTVDSVEVDDSNVHIGYAANGGNWGDFKPDEQLRVW